MDIFKSIIGTLNDFMWSQPVLITLVLTGLVFTIWTGFGQWRALTHGVAVIRGKYDDKKDPGAINHFQALSTALSATVGLGNIGGVAVAVALGGPGAILWMWVIGFLGMALKMTEVTQSMLYRNTDNPENPHGGPMFVAEKGFAKWGMKPIGTAVGVLFVITLLISTITGGNMFQAFSVADTTFTSFQIPREVSGIFMALLVGMVIIGGIRWIGKVASAVVPFMCGAYLIAGIYILIKFADKIPDAFAMIINHGLPEFLGGAAANPENAFLGGTFGYALQWGMKRALFSSEAGQGSAPIAHSAAKTDEPVREGVVAGLEPFVDTIIVCTITALIIFCTGAYNREAQASFASPDDVKFVQTSDGLWTAQTAPLPPKTPEARRIQAITNPANDWKPNEEFALIVKGDFDENTGRDLHKMLGKVTSIDDAGRPVIEWIPMKSNTRPTLAPHSDGTPNLGIYGDYKSSTLTVHAFDRAVPGLGKYLVGTIIWLFAISTMISWSYYGEQGVYFLFAKASSGTQGVAVFVYRALFCAMTIVATTPIYAKNEAALDLWTGFGTGVMLMVNIPLMWIFGPQAMKAYHHYIGRLKRGEFKGDSRKPADFKDVVTGHDVE